MAFLFCNTRQMTLDANTRDIEALKSNIAGLLNQSAFFDVINNSGEVAGNRAGMRLSILHLPISGRTFYQQVMAAGDDENATLSLVNEVVHDITF